MHFFHIGKLMAVFSICIACAKIDYYNNTQWIFVNTTNEDITITSGDNLDRQELHLSIRPGETQIINIKIPSTNKNLSIRENLSPYARTGANIYWKDLSIHLKGIDEGGNNTKLLSICNALNFKSSQENKHLYNFHFNLSESHLNDLQTIKK